MLSLSTLDLRTLNNLKCEKHTNQNIYTMDILWLFHFHLVLLFFSILVGAEKNYCIKLIKKLLWLGESLNQVIIRQKENFRKTNSSPLKKIQF